MATLGAYKTASNYVEVKLEYSYSRSSDGTSYTVTGTPYFHRTNTGYTTSGTVFSGLFVNGTRVATKSQYVSTSNSTWVSAGSMTYTKTGLSPTSDYTITIGFATCCEVANLATGKTATAYNVYPSSATYTSSSITLPKTITYTACGTPTDVKITTTSTGTFTISAKAGSNGTTNATSSVDLYYTIDGTNPTTSNYRETFNISATAGTTVSKTFTFTELPTSAATSLFGTDLAATVKLVARTRGAAGSSYYSGVSSVASANFTWTGRPTVPKITSPTAAGYTVSQDYGFRAQWEPPENLANNTISGYIVYLIREDTGDIADYATITGSSQRSYWFDSSSLEPGRYKIDVTACCSNGINSASAVSDGVITVVPTGSYLPDAIINVDDFGCASKETGVFAHRIHREHTFLDVGAGSIFRAYWDDVSQPYNHVIYYDVAVYAVSDSSDSFLMFADTTSKTEFYLHSETLRTSIKNLEKLGYTFDTLLPLHIVVTAVGSLNRNSCYSTAERTVAVTKAGGLLYTVPTASGIPKTSRAIAYIHNNDNWQPIEALSARQENTWVSSDIRYTSLLDMNGEPIVDSSGERIFA